MEPRIPDLCIKQSKHVIWRDLLISFSIFLSILKILMRFLYHRYKSKFVKFWSY